MAKTLFYVSGLPQGRPEDRLTVEIKRGKLHIARQAFLRRRWQYTLPIAQITDVQIQTTQEVSNARILAFGAITGTLAKVKHYLLTIQTTIDGYPTTVMLHGDPRTIEQLRQDIVRVRQRAR